VAFETVSLVHAGGNTVDINTEAASSEITEYHPPDDNLGTGMYAFLFIVIYYAVYSTPLYQLQPPGGADVPTVYSR